MVPTGNILPPNILNHVVRDYQLGFMEGDSHVREEPKPLGKHILREMRGLAESSNLREHPVSVVGCLHGLFMFIP